MPVFWIGALMNPHLGFKLGIFPNGGYVPLTENPADWLYHMILPWTALSILFIGIYSLQAGGPEDVTDRFTYSRSEKRDQ